VAYPFLFTVEINIYYQTY